MDTLQSIRAFHQVVEQKSFTKAADHLAMSVPMVSKHVANLERMLGAKLLHRNSRSIHLTEVGEQYYRQSLHALDVLGAAAQQAAGAQARPTGELKIAMPLWFASTKVATWLAEFRTRYPEVSLNLSLSNYKVDLVAGGFDLALRLSNNPNPSMIIRPLGVVEFYLVAAPSYLRKHGIPKSPEEIAQHEMVQPSHINAEPMQLRHLATGAVHDIAVKSTVQSDDTLMIAKLVQAGVGLACLPSWAIEADLAAGRLMRLLPEYHVLSVDLYAAYVDRAFLSAKVRAFIDFMVEKCAD